MIRYLFFLALIIPYATSVAQGEGRTSIEILDDRALAIIDPSAEIETIADGFMWTEGPLWVADGAYWLFSDIPNNKVFKWDGETIREYLNPSGFMGKDFTGEEPGSNGLLLDPEGRLVLMQHGERRVARMKAPLDDPKPEFEVVAETFEGKRFNSPNDGVFDTQGNLYFTDPPYGLPQRMDDPGKELDFQGVYCKTASGALLLLDTLSRPNGIALSPDEGTLYVAVSDSEHVVWYRYAVERPGHIKDKEIFYEVTHLIGQAGQQGLPDGMVMHGKGILFATGPGGVWVLHPDGTALARIYTGQSTANCALSGDEKVLMMTADDYLMQLPLR